MKGFDRFWLAYPRKERKMAAREAWSRIVHDDADVEVLVEAAKVYRRATADTELRYITTPDRWLLERRWEDEHLRPRISLEERMTQRGPGIYYPGSWGRAE